MHYMKNNSKVVKTKQQKNKRNITNHHQVYLCFVVQLVKLV